ncbi:MAG: DUF1822 family protein [Mastigocoleus sp. MO_167.B18]|uniref:DUF1822 family protein n=1 Tax=Mastigocoleus sp. MO_188.B34 TaxID=3036635 RepID=UPI0026191C2F|nr:DUF1822 family protein [Mastigocoleus sp. MO_188.B34]MDJ0695572.1 DUF1822 family protein [Mastigocoleus sp. MO_188.B34]MDJ0774260.1 DUF1822 family protein [Mastigocoleus sp. MO_167.B18]
MINNLNLFNFARTTELILEIPEKVKNPADFTSGFFSNPNSRYQGYINKLCLGTVLPWIREDIRSNAKPFPNTAVLSSFWELVNGSAVDLLDGTKLILVPTEAIDSEEIRVPQEWVDIPSWVGDYYLGIQVEPEGNYVRVWGYCTHAQLKDRGTYDPSSRTYVLDNKQIIDDISALATAIEFCREENTRTAIAPVPHMSVEHAQNLIERLGDSQIIEPRLEIPFSIWSGLLEHGGWRTSLYHRRLGRPDPYSVMRWLRDGMSQFVEQIGWQSFNLELSAATARNIEEKSVQVAFSRQLIIAGQSYELCVTPKGEYTENIWRFELRNNNVGAVIPGGFKLRLLSEDLQPFPNNEDIATTAVEQLFVEVALEAGEGIVWEIEPLPENYDYEILRF